MKSRLRRYLRRWKNRSSLGGRRPLFSLTGEEEEVGLGEGEREVGSVSRGTRFEWEVIVQDVEMVVVGREAT